MIRPEDQMNYCLKILFTTMVMFTLTLLTVSAQNKSVEWNETIDITYKAVHEQELKLDIYKPATSQTNLFPVVVYIHGGSWVKGDKSMVKDGFHFALFKSLINNGYAIVSIDYRLINQATTHFPAPIEDCKDAVRWLRKNGQDLQLDTAHIGLWGTSAGAHLSMLTAYTKVEDFHGAEELRGYSSKVNYVIDNFGPVDINKIFKPLICDFVLWTLKLCFRNTYDKRQSRLEAFTGLDLKHQKRAMCEMCRLYSPSKYINQKSVPTLIFHGNLDYTVPLVQSKILNRRLQKCGIPHELIIYRGQGHGLKTLNETNKNDMINRTLAFIKKYN